MKAVDDVHGPVAPESGIRKISLLASVSLAVLSLAGAASAGSFVNGGFETGDFTGWDQGGGTWFGGAYPVPSAQFPGTASPTNAITSAGFDPLTDNHLRTVYAGAHSARVNDSNNNYSVSAIRQVVNNYTDNQIAFAYAAVLQASHGATDSDAFIVQLTDLTTGAVLFNQNVNSATAPASAFTRSSSGWYYTDWTTEAIAVTPGDSYELALLANDCPYGGHAGYAYLDGFGAVIPPAGGVPEPATWAMLIAGFGMTGAVVRRRRKGLAAA
jgi:hypothetical protein